VADAHATDRSTLGRWVAATVCLPPLSQHARCSRSELRDTRLARITRLPERHSAALTFEKPLKKHFRIQRCASVDRC
jgi:hypothetical protein